MIGYFNYTVWLTYLSLASATTGIVLTLTGDGHPFVGMFFMLFCALCDAFDGKVARTKKDRSVEECKYGIQIDSLSDIVAFGVLPASIAAALVFRSNVYNFGTKGWDLVFTVVAFAIMIFFVLAGLIRLAYFNVTEEEMQSRGEKRTYYEGLPVTCSSLILSVSYFICGSMGRGLCWIYNGLLVVIGSAFVLRFKMPKVKLGYVVIISFIGLGLILTALFLRGKL